MAETEDGIPVIACCPPGYHDHLMGTCMEAIGTSETYTPKPKVWFTQNFISGVWVMQHFPGWDMVLRRDGFPLMKHRNKDGNTYVWRLTDVYGGPKNFWREGVWPD